jgi:hypothetical protein
MLALNAKEPTWIDNDDEEDEVVVDPDLVWELTEER